MSQNPISEQSFDALSALLNENPNLVVNMRMNNIQDDIAIMKVEKFEQ